MEASFPNKRAFGESFRRGAIHLAFGIVVPSDDETTHFCVVGMCNDLLTIP